VVSQSFWPEPSHAPCLLCVCVLVYLCEVPWHSSVSFQFSHEFRNPLSTPGPHFCANHPHNSSPKNKYRPMPAN